MGAIFPQDFNRPSKGPKTGQAPRTAHLVVQGTDGGDAPQGDTHANQELAGGDVNACDALSHRVLHLHTHTHTHTHAHTHTHTHARTRGMRTVCARMDMTCSLLCVMHHAAPSPLSQSRSATQGTAHSLCALVGVHCSVSKKAPCQALMTACQALHVCTR